MTKKIKESLAKVVVSEMNAKITNKSSGTKIATNKRVLPITVIQPFSK